MEKITFCIPSKNNKRYLEACIPSIRKNSYRGDHDIIVFVDADNDGTCDALDTDFDPSQSDGNETKSGFDRFQDNLPGFTAVISSLALLGAAIGVGLSGRRKND